VFSSYFLISEHKRIDNPHFTCLLNMSSNEYTHGTAVVSLVPDCSTPTLKCRNSWLPDRNWGLFDEPGVVFEPFQGEDPEEDILNMLTCPAGPDSIRRSLIDGLNSGQEWELNWYKREGGSRVLGTPKYHGQGKAPCFASLILISNCSSHLRSGRLEQAWICGAKSHRQSFPHRVDTSTGTNERLRESRIVFFDGTENKRN
jgi:hypothetical protein